MRSQDTVQRSFNIKSFLARSSYMGSDFERRGWEAGVNVIGCSLAKMADGTSFQFRKINKGIFPHTPIHNAPWPNMIPPNEIIDSAFPFCA
jgi:hypothetical protein